jgi:hypothetical protein
MKWYLTFLFILAALSVQAEHLVPPSYFAGKWILYAPVLVFRDGDAGDVQVLANPSTAPSGATVFELSEDGNGFLVEDNRRFACMWNYSDTVLNLISLNVRREIHFTVLDRNSLIGVLRISPDMVAAGIMRRQ